MTDDSLEISRIRDKFNSLQPFLNERAVGVWCAAEAKSIGRGGKALVHKATGVSWPTIIRGLSDLENPIDDGKRIRRKGGGRKKITDKDPTLLEDLDKLIDPVTRGDPESALRWTSKSTIKLAAELQARGHQVTQRTVHRLLVQQKYSLKSNRKRDEGGSHPDRDLQFQYINEKCSTFQAQGCPVLSVDAKKKENIGNYKNNGKEWSAKGKPTDVNVYDFPDKIQGKAAPYGVFDLAENEGWVSVGISSDTAEFALESLRCWWSEMGRHKYKDAPQIMITADCGGSNGYRVRLWKYELQTLANELNKTIVVCHFPPGTSKWNKIEHRLFSYISQNWRAQPLLNLQTIVELIGNTRTKTGLTVKIRVDNKTYQTGKKIPDDQFNSLHLKSMDSHPE